MVQLDIRALDLRLLPDRDSLLDDWGGLRDILEEYVLFLLVLSYGAMVLLYMFLKNTALLLISQRSKIAKMRTRYAAHDVIVITNLGSEAANYYEQQTSLPPWH